MFPSGVLLASCDLGADEFEIWRAAELTLGLDLGWAVGAGGRRHCDHVVREACQRGTGDGAAGAVGARPQALLGAPDTDPRRVCPFAQAVAVRAFAFDQGPPWVNPILRQVFGNVKLTRQATRDAFKASH